MNAKYREHLGRLVRLAWVAYCKDTGDMKPSHIAPWEELSEWDKEADRCIGEAIVRSITDVADGERVMRQAETIRLFSAELTELRAQLDQYKRQAPLLGNDEYCPKHDTWFGREPCPGCRAVREHEREVVNAEYTRYLENGGKLDFDSWLGA